MTMIIIICFMLWFSSSFESSFFVFAFEDSPFLCRRLVIRLFLHSHGWFFAFDFYFCMRNSLTRLSWSVTYKTVEIACKRDKGRGGRERLRFFLPLYQDVVLYTCISLENRFVLIDGWMDR
jgi:hypothetical protein